MNIEKFKDEFELIKKIIESKILSKEEANKLAEIFLGFGFQYGEDDPTHAENLYDEIKQLIDEKYR